LPAKVIGEQDYDQLCMNCLAREVKDRFRPAPALVACQGQWRTEVTNQQYSERLPGLLRRGFP